MIHARRVLPAGLALVVAAFVATAVLIPVAASTHELRYYGDLNCPTCYEKKAIIEVFAASNPTVLVEMYMLDFTNATQRAFHREAFESRGLAPGLGAILNRSGETCVLYLEAVTTANLDRWLAGEEVCQPASLAPWIAFLTGLAVGASACVLLLLGTIGTAITSATTRRQYATFSTGLVLGVLAGYVAIAALFTWFVGTLGFLEVLKYILAGALLFIGAWQIIDARRERSFIFATPTRVKGSMRRLIEGRKATGAFVVGLMFALVKVPCFGGPFLAIIYGARTDPALLASIFAYFAGMLLPYIVILAGFGVGLTSERVNAARVKYRPHLRVTSGLVMVVLVIYMLAT